MEEGEVKEKVSSFDILPDANPVNVETFVSIKVRDEDLKTEKESSPSLEEREGTNSSTITDKDESLAIEPDIQSPSSQPETSTPIHRGLRMDTSQTTVQFDIDASSLISDSRFSVESKESILPDDIKVPIVGYEIMEERAKFTVFKVKVDMGENNSWFVFRRYTDFVHLNNRLKRIFPHVRFSLPPKRWFKDNFDKNFIEDRLLGLQAFVDNCTCHKEISNCKPVREFFCFDDPPGPHESLEESRAVCESLEDTVYNLRRDLDEKDVEVKLLQEELNLYKKQVEMLTEALRSKNASTRSLESQETRSTKSAEFPETGSTKSAESPETGSTKSAESPERGSTKSLESPESPSSTSLAECDLMTCPEADQSHMQKSDVPAETKSKPTPEIQEKATNKKKEKSRSRFTFRKKSVS